MKLEAPMVAIFPLLVSILLLNTFSMNFATAQSTPFPSRVGVVADMDSDVGKMRLSCIEMAISDYYTRHGYYQTRMVLDKRDVVGAAAAAVVNHISYLNVQCNLEIHDEIVARSDRKKADTCDELIYAVHQGKFHAAVGDVTILANRSQYVDFNLPYTEAGISMVVAMKSNKSKNACVFLADALEQVHILYWTVIPSSATDRFDHKKADTYDELVLANRSQYVNFTLPYTEAGISSNKTKNACVFLKPPTWKLCLTSFCLFVFMGFSIWILEHQVGTMFLFASSTKLISNLSRLLLIIWLLLVLTLAIELTSMSTVQELRPTITDVNELIRNKENICYRNGSFV